MLEIFKHVQINLPFARYHSAGADLCQIPEGTMYPEEENLEE